MHVGQRRPQWLLLAYFASMLAHLPATSPLQPTPSCGLHTVLCDNRDVVSVPNNSYANPIFPAALDIPAVLESNPPLPSNTIRPHGDCERAHSVTVGALHSATCMGTQLHPYHAAGPCTSTQLPLLLPNQHPRVSHHDPQRTNRTAATPLLLQHVKLLPLLLRTRACCCCCRCCSHCCCCCLFR